MMPPLLAADDVSLLTLRNDVASLRAAMMRCLPSCAEGTHHSRSNIIAAGSIICPTGQTSFKKTPFVGRQKTFFCWRRRRDSNSRAGSPTYALSRGASSTCLSTSPSSGWSMCDRTALLYNTPGGMSRKIRKFCPRFSRLPFFAEKRAPPFRKGEKDRLRRGKTPVFAGRSGLLMQTGCDKIRKKAKRRAYRRFSCTGTEHL